MTEDVKDVAATDVAAEDNTVTEKYPPRLTRNSMRALEALITAQVLFLYAATLIKADNPEMLEDIKAEAIRRIEQQGNYSTEEVKILLFDTLSGVVEHATEYRVLKELEDSDALHVDETDDLD